MSISMQQSVELQGGTRIFALADLNTFAGKDIEFTSSALTRGIHYGRLESEPRENVDPKESTYTVHLTDQEESAQPTFIIRAGDLSSQRLVVKLAA